jgi:hypothetical protein
VPAIVDIVVAIVAIEPSFAVEQLTTVPEYNHLEPN